MKTSLAIIGLLLALLVGWVATVLLAAYVFLLEDDITPLYCVQTHWGDNLGGCIVPAKAEITEDGTLIFYNE